jgi:probable F420-dependent oxidoreductase
VRADPGPVQAMKAAIGRLGIWTAQFDFHPALVVRDAAAELESLGYGAVWLGENVGHEPLIEASILLAATRHLVAATGIASIYARDAGATTAAHLTLAEAYPGRFLLGVGVSHALLVERTRRGVYGPPVASMRNYLDAMADFSSAYRAVRPPGVPLRLLGALGPRMLALAAEKADGAHTYLAPPAHTAQARGVLGRDAILAVEQAVVLDAAPSTGRELARRHVRRYLPLANYVNHLRRLGFDDADFIGSGSDRLVDALVACGGRETIAERVQEHLGAGADHVCIQVLSEDKRGLPAVQWRELAGLVP